jgi:hypothetical protein
MSLPITCRFGVMAVVLPTIGIRAIGHEFDTHSDYDEGDIVA